MTAAFYARTLLAFALLHFALQGQSCLLLWVSLDFLVLHSSPLSWKGHLLVLVLGGLVGHHRTIQLQFFRITVWGIDLDYCDIEWFALEMNRNHLLIFDIAPKYCISDSFVDCVGYSISSKGFLPTYRYNGRLNYMQSTSWEMLYWMKKKLESRLPVEISIISDMQMTPPLWQKANKI